MKTCSILILILLFYSCNSNDNNKEIAAEKNSDQSTNQKLDGEARDPDFNTIFTKISDVELKPDEKHLIANISAIVVTNDNYVIADRRGKQLLVFGRKGKLENSIGRIGDGPGEFRHITDIDVNKGNEILLLDAKNKRVSKFKLGGKFLSSYRVDFGESILADSENGFFIYEPNCGIKPNAKEKLIKHYNDQGKIDISFCTPFFEFGIVSGKLMNDREGNLYVTQFFHYGAQKYSPHGKYLLEIGKMTKYYRYFELNDDKILPPIEELNKVTVLGGFGVNSKYSLAQFANTREPNRFSWIDLYDLKGNLLHSGIKVPDELLLYNVGDDDLFYFVYTPIDNSSAEVPNPKIVGYDIKDIIK